MATLRGVPPTTLESPAVNGKPLIVGRSEAIRSICALAERVAQGDAKVLITGESGVGKDLVAQHIHYHSRRASQPLVAVNCAGIPETLLESEFFGHDRGAFTDAHRDKVGKLQLAHNGTIFLDEVAEMSLRMQAMFLRFLENGEIHPVGADTATTVVDVRVIAATNRDLAARVAAGTFREDLYYRLAVFPISLAPLRERPEDLRPLVEHFLARHAALMNRRPPEVPEPLWAALRGHAWPGNVRELENLVQRALILSPGPVLELPGPLGGELARGPAAAPPPEGEERPPGTFEDEVRGVIERALDACGGRIYGPHGAAALLGLKPSTLQGKMKRHGVPDGRGRKD
jgi:formate hydrogenlyase transcriptional activator